MDELYKAIEAKIKASGYPRPISGEDVYNDICDQIEEKENGTYLLLSKFEEDVVFEYHITIRDEEFNRNFFFYYFRIVDVRDKIIGIIIHLVFSATDH